MFTLSLGVVAFCSLAALVAGFIDSIAGGGGLITIPALLISGVPPHLALGTNKMQSSMGTALSVYMFANGHLVLWRLALWGLPFSLLGASFGSSLALYLDEALLGRILVLLLPAAMVLSLLPKKDRGTLHEEPQGRRFWLGMPLVSATIGCYDGFFGPGTGSFFILGLHWILQVGLVQASATTKVLNLASNLGALVVFAWNGQFIGLLALPMICASMLGNFLGSRTAMRIGPKAVRLFLIVSLGLLMTTLLVRFFFS